MTSSGVINIVLCVEEVRRPIPSDVVFIEPENRTRIAETPNEYHTSGLRLSVAVRVYK